jgi:hypothetical protein
MTRGLINDGRKCFYALRGSTRQVLHRFAQIPTASLLQIVPKFEGYTCYSRSSLMKDTTSSASYDQAIMYDVPWNTAVGGHH